MDFSFATLLLYDKAFHFDKIFFGKDNKFIYEKITPILKQVDNSEHGAILAYGQTASGKTLAMEGSENIKGIIPLAIEYFIDRHKRIGISIFELYNEKIFDLLDSKKEVKQFAAVSSKEVNVENVKTLLEQGKKSRATGSTKKNGNSSRSHYVVKIVLDSASLVLVDMAGSEAAETNSQQQFTESININLSLLALSTTIHKMSNGEYATFRGSILTKLLEPAFIGKCVTMFICTISLASEDVENSLSTLTFASSLKKVVTRISKDVEKMKQTGRHLLGKTEGIESELKKVKDEAKLFEEKCKIFEQENKQLKETVEKDNKQLRDENKQLKETVEKENTKLKDENKQLKGMMENLTDDLKQLSKVVKLLQEQNQQNASRKEQPMDKEDSESQGASLQENKLDEETRTRHALLIIIFLGSKFNSHCLSMTISKGSGGKESKSNKLWICFCCNFCGTGPIKHGKNRGHQELCPKFEAILQHYQIDKKIFDYNFPLYQVDGYVAFEGRLLFFLKKFKLLDQPIQAFNFPKELEKIFGLEICSQALQNSFGKFLGALSNAYDNSNGESFILDEMQKLVLPVKFPNLKKRKK